MLRPSSVSVCATCVWFDTAITTGPAPTRFGDTVTPEAVITPLR
jgi:hypothetical protein